jgi:hypothetical protein
VCWVLTGCGITHTPLEVALGDGASATGAAALAVHGLDDGDLTTHVARAAVGDSIRAISKAAATAGEYKASARAERRVQDRAVDLIARAVRHLHDADDHLSSPADRARIEQQLRRDRDQLEKLSTQAGELG